MSNAKAIADIYVGQRGINVIREGFKNLPKQLTLALRRAVWQTSRRIKREVDQSFIRVSGVKASVIKSRLFLKFKSETQREDGYYSSVWIGLNPISLSKLDPVEQSGGVKAGPVFVPEAFMPKGKFGKTVFTRRYEDQRLPWDKEFYHFDERMMQDLQSQVMPQVQRIFEDQFRKEVIGLFYEREQKTKQRARERAARR